MRHDGRSSGGTDIDKFIAKQDCIIIDGVAHLYDDLTKQYVVLSSLTTAGIIYLHFARLGYVKLRNDLIAKVMSKLWLKALTQHATQNATGVSAVNHNGEKVSL